MKKIYSYIMIALAIGIANIAHAGTFTLKFKNPDAVTLQTKDIGSKVTVNELGDGTYQLTNSATWGNTVIFRFMNAYNPEDITVTDSANSEVVASSGQTWQLNNSTAFNVTVGSGWTDGATYIVDTGDGEDEDDMSNSVILKFSDPEAIEKVTDGSSSSVIALTPDDNGEIKFNVDLAASPQIFLKKGYTLTGVEDVTKDSKLFEGENWVMNNGVVTFFLNYSINYNKNHPVSIGDTILFTTEEEPEIENTYTFICEENVFSFKGFDVTHDAVEIESVYNNGRYVVTGAFVSVEGTLTDTENYEISSIKLTTDPEGNGVYFIGGSFSVNTYSYPDGSEFFITLKDLNAGGGDDEDSNITITVNDSSLISRVYNGQGISLYSFPAEYNLNDGRTLTVEAITDAWVTSVMVGNMEMVSEAAQRVTVDLADAEAGMTMAVTVEMVPIEDTPRTVYLTIDNPSVVEYGLYQDGSMEYWGFNSEGGMTLSISNAQHLVEVVTTKPVVKITSSMENSFTMPALPSTDVVLDLQTAQEGEIINLITSTGNSAVNEIETDNGENIIYNIHGMRVNPENLAPGIYVKHGRKVVVK